MKRPAIAIVGMGCRYPDAGSPEELWENVLAQRRAFRQLPPERLNADDYGSDDRDAPDRTYALQAAVLEGYAFDRVRFRVSGSTYRAADLAHWLTLDVAARALEDAGFPDGEGLPREATGVMLGNTLTGEFSRANVMRLRWPYVRRVLTAALAEDGWTPEQRRPFLAALEDRYKAPFPPVGAETLAGGLSNTIAGRICNYFNLQGGGYTVDGACASSLLAVIHACTALAAGDLDVALAGGVDLSLDPFELVGFAKTGALAAGPMRVYDARSDGFIPGEGCGFVVLMPHAEALRQGRRVYAVIRGWGVSSDGAGGITRPDVEGQLLALRRAYRRAAFGPETVALFEGHGTGTRVGDAVELRVLAQARRDAASEAPPAAVGSIKANIGHTKAAAGLAGLLKATMAVHHQRLPPTTGCETPHAELTGAAPALRVLREGEPWPARAPLRAGVSAMGFGGINTHVVLEGTAPRRRGALHAGEQRLQAAAQEAEVFLLGARDRAGLRRQVAHLLTFAPKLSLAELTDLAAHLAASLEARAARAAVVAATPAELAQRLETLAAWLEEAASTRLETGVALGLNGGAPRIGFLFPGQGSPAHLDGGAWRRRFESVRARYAGALFPKDGDGVATDLAQPAIVTASVAGLRVLEHCGVTACTAVGHSLGELTALHWAGAFDEAALLDVATARGRAMADLGDPTGAMASVAAGLEEVEALIGAAPVLIAGLNGPAQTVLSGEADAVEAVLARARSRGWRTQRLRVSHAFHSPLVAAAAPPLAAHLAGMAWQPLQRQVVSTVTGGPLAPDEDLAALLCRQVTTPVRFAEALTTASQGLDLWIEVGPGRVLSTLAAAFLDVPAVATDAGGASLRGWLEAVGAAFALGAPVRPDALFEGRFTRPFSLDWRPHFLVNPCEQAPALDFASSTPPSAGAFPRSYRNGSASSPAAALEASHAERSTPESAIDLVRRLVAERAELPLAAVRDEDRLLSDLHLNSITVSELLVEAGRRLHLAPSAAPTNYADATLAEVAEALEARVRLEGPAPAQAAAPLPAGIDAWIRPFTVALVERARPRALGAEAAGAWQVMALPEYPLTPALKEAFDRDGPGDGVVVGLPPDPGATHVRLLLDGARAAMASGAGSRFVLVQHGGGAAAFARTLHLEAPHLSVCVVDVPADHPDAAAWVLAEAQAAAGYVEAHYDAAGTRREPRLRLLPPHEAPAEAPLGPDDVLLVTGGGKGITAACALALGRETGARLVLLGRSHPDADAEVAATLARMNGAGLRCRYLAADVTDAGAVRAAVAAAEAAFGPVTAVLHGAARNVPQRLGALDEAAVLATLAPKVAGLLNVLAALDPARLRLLLGFGSIIARMGLPGEADYALANEWLTRETERWQRAHPSCRCLAVEWSVWSEVGMGARLGSLDALLHRGVTPLPPEEAVAMLLRLLARPVPGCAVVVAGRFGDPPTLQVEQPDLPFLRFLEQPRCYVPGVELVVEAQLAPDADPYLDDHVLQGERLLPAVVGLEAMAQAATALAEASGPPVFEDVSFNRPVAVPGGGVTIRVAALLRAPGVVEVALRSESTAFQTDHFRAVCRFGAPASAPASIPEIPRGDEPIPLDPDRDLYGGILFHRGRFRRLRGYRRLRATACVAEIAPDEAVSWFGRYLPADLVLGDPGARDAALHAIQACIPHATLVPVGVDRLRCGEAASGPRFVHARERARRGDTFVYDVAVADAAGRVIERWEGLRLQRVGPSPGGNVWAAPLLGPYLERRMQELMPAADVSVAVLEDGAVARRARSDRAIRQALGDESAIHRRTNGKPEADGARSVSAAHAGGLTLAVAGAGPLGCDVEAVRPRSEARWRDLLGPERFDLALLIARETGEAIDAAATRVWTALESLKKAAAPPGTPLVLDAAAGDGWVILAAGGLRAATFVTEMQGSSGRSAFAILGSSASPSPAVHQAARAAVFS